MASKKKNIREIEYTPSKYQQAIYDYIVHENGNLVVEAAAGSGKCLGKGTRVIMFDGTIKLVEDIVVGDKLMGDDSTPRTVLSTTIGNGELCKIIPKKSEPWICNDVHILTIDHYRQKYENGIRKGFYQRVDVAIDELERDMVIDGLKITKHNNGDFRQLKLVKPDIINFTEKTLPIDPYIYGVWLGDGAVNGARIISMDEEIINGIKEKLPNGYFITERNYRSSGRAKTIDIHNTDTQHNELRRFLRGSSVNGEKFIYHDYLTSSREDRLELLAGLIDTDGYCSNKCYYEIACKSDSLARDILFLSRSLGLSAYDHYRNKTCYNNGVTKKYHIISIYGKINDIPVRMERKKAKERIIQKDNLHEGFRIEHIGNGDYYGFTLDGNGRFLLEDFTITHNTTTLVNCLRLIPEFNKVLLCAFNKDIVTELEKKTKDFENVDVRTLHGLGLTMLRRNYPTISPVPNVFKYESYIKNNLRELSSLDTRRLSSKDYFRYVDNIKKYVDYGRFYLCSAVKDLDFIEDRYDIETIRDEKLIALEVMEWGKTELEDIDYTDMVWFPHVLNLKPVGLLYDFIMVDECQDMNKAERELILKCRKENTRLVSVGDSNQCQPTGTKVLLPDGSEKNIESLDVGDYVVTYNSDWGYYVGYKKISRAGNITYQQCKKVTSIEHHTEDEIITIETNGGMKSSYTPGHMCYARINKALQKTAYCTYIMRNEKNLYRIGKTKLCRNSNSFSLNHRMISENCVDAWIIGIFKTEKEARICEIVNSYKFGIPQLVFDNERACGKRRTPYFMNEEISSIYEMIGENIEERAKKCLEYNHKKIEFPIISKYTQNYISSNHFTTFRACNLFPEFMEVNTFNENNFKYKYKRKNDIEKSSKVILRTPDVIKNIYYEKKECEVYSLNVEGLHNYVADGILTHNCLYTFAGGDPDSFKELKSIPNTKCLPLSISYRCPRNVVDFAKQLVPTIEANEANTNEGKVLFDVSLDDAEDGDMILCRNNAPLVQVYNEFLKLGKKAYIRGKDIGSNLKKLVQSTRQTKINADCREDGLFVRLYDDLFTTRNQIMEKSAVDAQTAMKSPIIDGKLDMIKALEVLSEGINTTDELIAKIDEIFPKKDKKEGISLSTIHKAKGLEANNVYIVCRSLMPSKSAKKDWEIQQEHNLMYVAYTRAKDKLGFVNEKDFEQFDITNLNNQNILGRIESQVNRVLGRSTKIIVNKSNALDIISHATKIERRIPSSTTVSINSTRRMNSFSDIFKNKRQTRVRR